MKNNIKHIILIVLFLSANLLAKPKLEIQPEKFSFGMIPQYSTVSHKFWFKSIGDDTLKITELKTGCSCAIMPLTQDFILPGDSLEVQFFWNVGRRIYKVGRYPYIFTNAKEDAYRISLTGEVHESLDSIKPVSISPYICELSRIREKSIDEIEFTLTNQSDQDLNISLLTPSVTECIIDIPHSIPAKGTAVGKIKVNDKFLDKEFKGSVTILLSDKNKTRITIPYRRKIFK